MPDRWRSMWPPYVPAAERRRRAALAITRFRKIGKTMSPIQVEGRVIAKTFWGDAWCRNLERYSDYANRLPRGRTYLRNGSVLDLRIGPREVHALVSGSSLYKVVVRVSPVSPARWRAMCRDCAGTIDSLVELLQGRFSTGVMERICRQQTGLFPAPAEINFSCSCPDWASMCKHVAAVLYGIGARLDEQPELLFRLRRVHEQDLIAKAGSGIRLSKSGPPAEKVLRGEGLSELFGLELAAGESAAAEPARRRSKRSRRGRPRGKAKR